jgi:hypothetical protein
MIGVGRRAEPEREQEAAGLFVLVCAWEPLGVPKFASSRPRLPRPAR